MGLSWSFGWLSVCASGDARHSGVYSKETASLDIVPNADCKMENPKARLSLKAIMIPSME